MDDELTLDEALAELSAAEDFLEYFRIDYEPSVVHVNRLHILQRFHDYIAAAGPAPKAEAARFDFYAGLLRRAYEDFVRSDALTEKVFKVFHLRGPHTAFVPLSAIERAGRTNAGGYCGCGGRGVCHSAEAALRSAG
ncbi:MAG: nitrogenase-stabilizing/protective protein NifW [Burkholderiales bacterium]|nr:nitrogenase-stabilizing/protective protein NifW [Burkholderiales bacterium]